MLPLKISYPSHRERPPDALVYVVDDDLECSVATDELGVAGKAIMIHRGRMMKKMDVASVARLVRIAEVAGIAPIPIGMPA